MTNFYEDLIPVEAEAGRLGIPERIAGGARPLVSWFEKNKRDLPWRRDPSPYHVWLSEIMLQQTRVEAVIPYYFRFLEVLPGISQLAQVEDEALMKLWQGLGYYNRARNLKKAAQVAVDQHGGKLPASYELLLGMPGIGPYTAGAVASLAYGLPAPAVDGNVLRVISRLIGSKKDIAAASTKKEMEQWIKRLLEENPDISPSAYNQGLMELGAMVCIPNGAPHCEVCPWKGLCLARQMDLIDQIPFKAPKKARKIEEKTVLVIRLQEIDEEMDPELKYALQKRPSKGLLAGLYELPNLDGYLGESDVLAAVEDYLKERNLIAGANCRIISVKEIGQGKHVFSHVEWHMKGYEAEVEVTRANAAGENKLMVPGENEAGSIYLEGFYDLDTIQQEIAVPNAFSTFMKHIFSEKG